MNRLIIFLVALLCLGVGFAFLHRPKDPVYQGKPLSYWLKQAEPATGRQQPGNAALGHYGPEAEGMLNALLTARDTSLVIKLQQLLAKQKLIKFRFQPAGELNWRGLHACSVLGPKVPGTVPALVKLVDRPVGSFRSRGAGYEVPLHILAGMGPKGIEALIHELDNKNRSIRLEAAKLLGTAPGAATPEVAAALQKCAADPDLQLQSVAAHSLKLNQDYYRQNIPAAATNLMESAGAGDGSLANLWDANAGLKILATSGIQRQSPAEVLFGGGRSRLDAVEIGNTVFESQPDGFVHFVEWETPRPVTVGSFGFVAIHDPAEGKFQRALRSFRLYARASAHDEYKLAYSEDVAVPYGAGQEGCLLFMFRNLATAVVGSQFRAEFVQYGDGMYNGSRVTQLLGFTPKLNWPMIEAAQQNQTLEIREETRGYFGK